jgi:uncharacterized protein (DUF736 family)
MSLEAAQRYAWNLACTLKVIIILIETDEGYNATLSVQAKGVRIVPDSNRANENAPSHRVMVGRAEIGAAWTKQSNEGRDYPKLAAPFQSTDPV